MIPLLVVRAPVGQCVDTSVKIRSRDPLDALANHNYQGVIRYVPLPANDASQDIDAAELELILTHPAGFWSAFVQHPRRPPWHVRDNDAEADARCAVRFARAAGYPSGTTGYVDLEGFSSDSTGDDVFGYALAWSRVLTEEGYRAGAYCGFDDPLGPDRLWELPDVHTYWSDLADRKVAERGTALVQKQQFTMAGMPWDPDEVREDLKGETPWVVRAAGGPAA